jgi:hypothetical protein
MLYNENMKSLKLTTEDRKIIKGIVKKLEKSGKEKQYHNVVIISFDKLYKWLNKKEGEVLKKFLSTNPKDYGFKGPKFGIKKVPKNLVQIKEQKYIEKQEVHVMNPKFISSKVYRNYNRLNKAMIKDLGRPILIDSGYRSPAYQILVLFHYLVFYKFDLDKTFKRVALPGYSEHGNGTNHGIDFITVYASPSDENPHDFEKTQEYKWLTKNASSFGFKMSYPRNNKHGVMFEPWHWRL